MRLSEYTDYALRVLMHCARHPERLVTISELAQGYGLSRNHLMKIVHDLGRQGLLQTTRGRSGGLRLGREPARISVGDVVRATETDFRQAECFDPAHSQCSLQGNCGVQGTLQQALAAYFAVLNHTTLADISAPRAQPVHFVAKPAA
jgi:Rrf2 family nitric oxide-sensitive transcriptional repressor